MRESGLQVRGHTSQDNEFTSISGRSVGVLMDALVVMRDRTTDVLRGTPINASAPSTRQARVTALVIIMIPGVVVVEVH